MLNQFSFVCLNIILLSMLGSFSVYIKKLPSSDAEIEVVCLAIRNQGCFTVCSFPFRVVMSVYERFNGIYLCKDHISF
jgi:hypothetical protein